MIQLQRYAGEALRCRRIERNLTVEQLAEKCGLPFKTVLHLETSCLMMNIGHVFKLTSALGVDANYFISENKPG